MSHEIELIGLDGSNPLGFLAALGALRSMASAMPQAHVCMSWRRNAAWRPVLRADPALSESIVVAALSDHLSVMRNHPAFAAFDNLEVSPEEYRVYAREAVANASSDRSWADTVAAFGCESIASKKNDRQIIHDTAFRTMSGAGHQDFVRFMRNIIEATTPEHLTKALFRPWEYDDPIRNLTLRWDPIDDSRYALRWGDPSKDGTRGSRGAVLGGNRLAIEGLLMMPAVPVGARLVTTGFQDTGARNAFWTWPIWATPVSCNVARSLVALRELQLGSPPRDTLGRTGVVEVYRCQRVTIGKYRNFTPAQPV